MSAQEFQADVKLGAKKPMDKPKSQQVAANQTTQPVTPAQPMQPKPVEQAAGFGEALGSLLSTGGDLSFGRTRPRAGRASRVATYQSGSIKGMTQDQAVEYAKQEWEKAPPEIREKYASRVQNRPAASERMAAFNQMDQVEQAQENINNLPGADEELVQNPEQGPQITTRTPRMGATGLKPQNPWKKPMDKPTSGAGYGRPLQ